MVDFPPTSNPWWVFAVFLAALIVFHVLLVRIWKLDKLGWKRVDYVWLGFAALGLIGAAADARQLFGDSVLGYYDAAVNLSYADFHVAVASLHDLTHRNLFAPKQEFADGEFKELRLYAEKLLGMFPLRPSEITKLDISILEGLRPQISDKVLLDALATLDRAASMCSSTVRARTNLMDASKTTSFEAELAMVAPFLLAVALALRITKVTGEIGIERRRPPTMSLPAVVHADVAPAAPPHPPPLEEE